MSDALRRSKATGIMPMSRTLTTKMKTQAYLLSLLLCLAVLPFVPRQVQSPMREPQGDEYREYCCRKMSAGPGPCAARTQKLWGRSWSDEVTLEF